MKISVSITSVVAVTCALLQSAFAGTPESQAAGLDFFESKIRPLLIEQCYDCHSSQAKSIKGGLHLDTREGTLKGGDTGPALVPGEPDKSLLIKAVRYTDPDLQMPPKKKKLSNEQIALLEQWVKIGAPDPRTGTANTTSGADKAATHWAFQPVKRPESPPVKRSAWVKTPVDPFILARLEGQQLRPSPPADRRTLIRRATYDLTGLPPTAEDVAAFEKDTTPDAYARLIDRLLASPHYGERWARYWLDVARYADTKGYVFEEERRYPFAWTYRDYVIRSFNEDVPFNRFLVEQLAADLLPLGEDKRPLAALGFLTLGRRFLNNQADIIDDRIDVMSRGMMGLTVACARCHDHKFDPIPIRDYYSLYGVFASGHEPPEKPLLGTNSFSAEYPAYLIEKKKREDALSTYRATKEAEVMTRLRSQVGDYLLAVYEGNASKEGKKEGLIRERKLDPGVARKWEDALSKTGQMTNAIFAPWFALRALPTNGYETAASQWLETNTLPLNPVMVAALKGSALKSARELADRYDTIFSEVDKEWRTLQGGTNAPAALADAGKEDLRKVLHGATSPLQLNPEERARIFDVPSIQKVRALRREVEGLDATHAGAPPRAMVMLDNAKPAQPRVFIRGNPGNPGPEVPRQFLGILAGTERKPFEKGSGRLEMAEAIASDQNPLTARVLVNRVWMQHFGTPLVRTPSDFGLRSDPPTHPELLDYLANEFMKQGWSLKKLHRTIMLSSAYQQSSVHDPVRAEKDPANELYWKMNRRRLDFEAFRDTLLADSGRLNPALYGRSVDITTEPYSSRRTVYSFIERQNLPGLFRTFDFASPDASSAGRFSTTVPQQALFLMNSPFVLQQARAVFERAELKAAGNDEAARIKALYQIFFQRLPDAAEMGIARTYLKSTTSAERAAGEDKKQPLDPWERYAQVLMLSNEVAFVD